jgi:hypothetical protein
VINAPDYCEPIVAWRVWYAVESAGELRLSSVYHRAHWPPREPLEAVCHRLRLPFRARHEAPSARCHCGIYAALPDVARDYLPRDSLRSPVPAVVGRVHLWGSVVECERGWRASHAYPEQLYVPILGRDADTAARVANGLKCYGVPIEVLDASAAEAMVEVITRSRKKATHPQ